MLGALVLLAGLVGCTSSGSVSSGAYLTPGMAATVQIYGDHASTTLVNDGPGAVSYEVRGDAGQDFGKGALTIGAMLEDLDGGVTFSLRNDSAQPASVRFTSRRSEGMRLNYEQPTEPK